MRRAAVHSDEAKSYLETLVLAPDPRSPASDVFFRTRAFYALKEIDSRAVLRVLKILPPDDPLRDEIIDK